MTHPANTEHDTHISVSRCNINSFVLGLNIYLEPRETINNLQKMVLMKHKTFQALFGR